jgi:3-oxoacyl-[acyl-carrier-protein] synthase II
MSAQEFITGTGLLTPLGTSVDRTWSAILDGRWINDHSRVPLDAAGDLPRVSVLAIAAAREAIAAAEWDSHTPGSHDTALVVGTSKGPIDAWMTPLPPRSHNAEPAGRLGMSMIASLADDLGRDLALGAGPRLTICAACASGLIALIRAAIMLRCGEASRAIVVAAESSLHPVFLGSFRRLGVLAPPGALCRPFSTPPTGFLVSEAAAAVCLERRARSDRCLGLDGSAMGSDAANITSADPSGQTPIRLIRSASAGVAADMVHAHATGTDQDSAELRAIAAALGPTIDPARALPVYSHKGAMGHSLGAAGLVAVVLNACAHRQGIVPANLGGSEGAQIRGLAIPTACCERPVRRSLVLATGFGGPSAAVTLRSA